VEVLIWGYPQIIRSKIEESSDFQNKINFINHPSIVFFPHGNPTVVTEPLKKVLRRGAAGGVTDGPGTK